MIQSKAFYLKVRKQGVRWGCPCCQPTGRDLRSRESADYLRRIIKAKDKVEAKLIDEIERLEQLPEEDC